MTFFKKKSEEPIEVDTADISNKSIPVVSKQRRTIPCIRAILQKPEEVFKQNLVHSLYA